MINIIFYSENDKTQECVYAVEWNLEKELVDRWMVVCNPVPPSEMIQFWNNKNCSTLDECITELKRRNVKETELNIFIKMFTEPSVVTVSGPFFF